MTGTFVYTDTIISQYANSPRLTALVDLLDAWINPSANIDDFYNMVWNVTTAVGYGLDVWGRIVGLNGRVLDVPAGPFFGFQQDTQAQPFNQAVFYAGTLSNGKFALSDDAFRQLILAKAAANLTDGSIPSVNGILNALFNPDGTRGNVYVADNLDMTMEYTFDFSLTPVEIAIAENSGVLPKPTGVLATVTIV